MAKLRPDQLPDATAGTKFAHVVNKQNTTDGPDGTSERLELSNVVGAVSPDNVFSSTTARDNYFTANPDKLIAGIYCIVETPFNYFRYSGSVWVQQTGVVTGPQGEKGDDGDVDLTGLSSNTVPVVNNAGNALVDSSITETDTNIIMTKTLIVPQDSLQIGPALTVSDKGGNLGLINQAEDKESLVATNPVFETEAQRDAIFPDGVPKVNYEYIVPAKWIYQFPFTSGSSNDNKISFELVDSDNTYIRKFRIYSNKANTGVRIWIENLLPNGDKIVWQNVTEEAYNNGEGDTLNATGFTEIEIGFIKISTANIRFRFNIQAQSGDTLQLVGESTDLGLGTYFYPRMYTYTQDTLELSLADGNDIANKRLGGFSSELRLDADKLVARSLGDDTSITPQSVKDTLVDNDRPDITYTNSGDPFVLKGVTVNHSGTWSPVQVSFNDLRTESVSLVDGDNTINITGKDLVIERGETFYIRFSGAVGTGSKSQISLMGNSSGEPYYKLLQTEIKEKEIDNGGSVEVVEFDVTQNPNRTVDNAYVGKLISITQSGSQQVMIITLASHDTFETGDVIRITRSKSYENYYFGVFYSTSQGQQLVVYPSDAVTLVRTNSGWDVDQSTAQTKAAIITAGQKDNALIGNEANIVNVQAISAVENDAVKIIEDGNGHATLQFDLNEIEPTSLSDNAPYRVYQSIEDIEADFGPITITPLDGVNDDQIRANNMVNIMDAIGTKAVANLVIGNDITIAPVAYSEIQISSHNSERTNALCFSKTNSKIYTFSASIDDVGTDTSGRWRQLYRLGTTLDMGGNDIENVDDITIKNDGTVYIASLYHENQSINYFNNGDISVGGLSKVDIGIGGNVTQSFTAGALDMSNSKVENLKDATNDQDAVSKLQSETFVSDEFKKAENAVTDSSAFEIDIRDATRDDGYGNSSGKINYLPINDNQVVNPDTSYGYLFFIHDRINTSEGVLMVHEDLLSQVVTSSTQEVPFKVIGASACLGKSNQVDTEVVGSNDAIWNCQGAAIHNTDNANVLPPPNKYFDKNGNPSGTENINSAITGTYSPGNFVILGNPDLTRAEVKNISNESVTVTPKSTSPWFVIRAKAGGGTFNVKKIFQLFFRQYDEVFFSTDDYALALGLKVQDNRERVEELEKQVTDLTPVEQPEDENGVVETIKLVSSVKNRMTLDVGESKVLHIGYQANQVNLVAYDVIIKSLVTDTNNENYGKNCELRGAIIKSDGAFSFIKSQLIGERLNINVSVATVDDELRVTLSGAPCELSINTKAVVKR